MINRLLLFLFLIQLTTSSVAQRTCPSWGPYLTSWNMDKSGELFYTEVMAPASGLQENIYWSTIDFSIGPRGGYCGIQNKPNGVRNNIFSVWDIQDTTVPQCFAEYTAPNTFVDGFGGEGTGLHTDNPFGWQPDVWYGTAIRRWYTGGSQTRVGFFMFDYNTGKWTHYVTVVTPETDAKFIGSEIGGFLENYYMEGNDTGTSVGYYRNSWAMNENGVFSKPTSYEANAGTGSWSATSALSNTAVKISSCGTVPGPGSSVTFNVAQAGTKPAPAVPVSIQSVTPAYAGGVIAVHWVTSDYTSPQLSYQVKIYSSVQATTPLTIINGIRPDTRSVTFALPQGSPAGNYVARVQLTDIFNQQSDIVSGSVLFDPTGIAYQEDKGAELHVYPNPVKKGDPVIFDLSRLSGQIYKVSLYNNAGSRVVTKQIKRGYPKIETDDLAAGLYFYSITDGSDTFHGKVEIK